MSRDPADAGAIEKQDPGDALSPVHGIQEIDVPVCVLFIHYRTRSADTDNQDTKALTDGLRHIGLYKDDSNAEIKETAHQVVKCKTKKEERTEVFIYEVV